MNTSRMFARVRLSVIGALLLTLFISSMAVAAPPQDVNTPTPDGFGKFLVYMAAGVYDPADPNYAAPDGAYFHKEIMGRSNAEIAQNRADAVAFFEQRFGLNPDEDAGVMFGPFMFDPRNDYRAYVVSGESVSSSGWVIRDGGWSLAVTAPDGITLGGEFEGRHVPAGTMMVYGDYNILALTQGQERGNARGAQREPIIIHYQSGDPIIPGPDGIAFHCELISEDFGHGLAQGVSAPEVLPDGRTQANVRNVLTFPGLGSNGN